MYNASLLIRKDRPYYSIFETGLKNADYIVLQEPKEIPDKNDILVLWNRLSTQEHVAKHYEDCGARVVIAENGWIGENNYALCLGQHNGAGRWPVKRESRWPSFGIALKPWREEGDFILVVPQRGMGVPPVAMARDWPEQAVAKLKKLTPRTIRVRPPQDRIHPFEESLKDCHAVVIWASGAGIKAIVAGIPVYYEMPSWIGAYAARYGLTEENLEEPYLGERATFCRTVSWAMWKAGEIQSGEAFRCLLA